MIIFLNGWVEIWHSKLIQLMKIDELLLTSYLNKKDRLAGGLSCLQCKRRVCELYPRNPCHIIQSSVSRLLASLIAIAKRIILLRAGYGISVTVD